MRKLLLAAAVLSLAFAPMRRRPETSPQHRHAAVGPAADRVPLDRRCGAAPRLLRSREPGDRPAIREGMVVIDKQRATAAKRSLFGFSIPNFGGLFGGADDEVK